MGACVNEKEIVEIYQGGTKRFFVFLKKKSTGEALDLTDATEITGTFPNEDDTVLDLTVGSGITKEAATSGKIRVEMTVAQVNALKRDERQDFQIKSEYASETHVVRFRERMNVYREIGAVS